MVAAGRRGHARGRAVFRRIWAAYDDSDEARAGFELAVGLARRSGARLTLVHIVPPVEEEESELDSALAAQLLGVRATTWWHARIMMAAARAAPDLDVETCVTCGYPPTALLELIEQVHPDLIVAGTHRIGGPWRGLLGGVAQRLRDRSPCPVVLVRPGQPTPRRGIVLVGVDDLERSAATLELGARLSRTLGARLQLVHVLTESPTVTGAPPDEHSLLDWAWDRLDGHLPAVAAELRRGPPASALLAACALHRPLAAVVGVRARAVVRSVLGRSVTDRLVNHAACPVAVARPRGRASSPMLVGGQYDGKGTPRGMA
jgi:nucleotide-binding universal stress UspA family protein